MSLLILSIAVPTGASEEDAVVYQYPYTDSELEEVFSGRPVGVTEGVPFELSSVEGSPTLEMTATATEVVRGFVAVVYAGQVATCPARLWFSASGDEVTRVSDAAFRLVMSGSWQLNWTVRAAPQDSCRAQHSQFEAVSFVVTVTLQDGRPVMSDAGGLPAPATSTSSAGGILPTAPASTDPQESIADGDHAVSDSAAATGATVPDASTDGGTAREGLAGFILLLLLALGGGALFGLYHLLRHWGFATRGDAPPPEAPPAAASGSAAVISDAPGTAVSFTTTVAPASVEIAELIPASGFDHIPATSHDGTRVAPLMPGTRVTVVDAQGTRALVRTGTLGRVISPYPAQGDLFWVKQSHLKMVDSSSPEPPPPPPE